MEKKTVEQRRYFEAVPVDESEFDLPPFSKGGVVAYRKNEWKGLEMGWTWFFRATKDEQLARRTMRESHIEFWLRELPVLAATVSDSEIELEAIKTYVHESDQKKFIAGMKRMRELTAIKHKP